MKPTIENGFEYKKLHWADLPLPPEEETVPTIEPGDATLAPLFPARRRRRAITWSWRPQTGSRWQLVGAAPSILSSLMLSDASKALAQMFTPSFRKVLLKSVGLAILLLIMLGIGLQRVFAWLSAEGAGYLEGVTGAGGTRRCTCCSGS